MVYIVFPSDHSDDQSDKYYDDTATLAKQKGDSVSTPMTVPLSHVSSEDTIDSFSAHIVFF